MKSTTDVLKDYLKELENPESSEFMKSFIKEFEKKEKEREKELLFVKTDKYISWLKNFVINNEHKSLVTDDIYSYPEEKNIEKLGAFVRYIEDLAEKQRVMNVTDKDNCFQTLNYVVKIDDLYFNVSQMHGQGCSNIVEMTTKPDYCFVTVR